MYNAKLVKDRISNLLRNKSCTQKQLLLNCDINPNALNQMSDKKGIGCFALARIADYLETSTDYLLGRTDTPSMNVSINSNVSAPQTNVKIFVDETPISNDERELLDMISRLTLIQRSQIILMIEKMLHESG